MAQTFEQQFPANHRQAAYWNVDIAQKWIDHQAALDLRFQAITDLLIGRAAPVAGECLIDVGCGTGATLLAAAPRVVPGGRLLGVDISAPMLEVARRRVLEAGLTSSLDLAQVDVQTHSFEAGGFDLALSRFGVMFFADPPAAFANLRTALRPGGRLAFVCWTDFGANPFFCLPLEVAVRHLGPPEERPPRAPGPFAFSEADYVRAILEQAKFDEIRIERVEVPVETPVGPAEEAAFACNLGPASSLIRERGGDGEAVAAALRSEIAAALAPFATADGMRIPAVVSMVTARRTTGAG